MQPKNSPFDRLAKGSYFLLLDNFTNLGIGAAFWFVLARITDPAIIGQAMIVISLAQILVAFSGQGIQTSISKYMSEYTARGRPNAARRMLNKGLKTSLLLAAGIAVIVSLLAGPIATFAYGDSSLSFLMILTISTFFPAQTITFAILGAFQGIHATKYVAITDFIYQSTRIVISIIALMYGLGALGIILGFSLAALIALAACYLFFLPRAIPKTNERDVEHEDDGRIDKGIAKFTGINYFTVGLKTLGGQLGVLIIGTQSFEWAAFYGLAMMLAKFIAFSHSIGGSLLPTATEEHAKGNRNNLRKLINVSVRLSIMISGFGLIALALDPEFVLGLISRSYSNAGLALLILSISAIINALVSILISFLNALNRPTLVAKKAIVSSAFTVALTFALVYFGYDSLEGPAIAILAGVLVGLILSLTDLKHKENISISKRSIVMPFISIASAFMIGTVFVLINYTLLGIVVALASHLALSLALRVTTRSEIRQIVSIAIHRKK